MIDKLTKDFLNKIVVELKKEDHLDKLENEIIAPVLANFSERIYPYVSLLFLMYSLNLILIIIILILIVFNKK